MLCYLGRKMGGDWGVVIIGIIVVIVFFEGVLKLLFIKLIFIVNDVSIFKSNDDEISNEDISFVFIVLLSWRYLELVYCMIYENGEESYVWLGRLKMGFNKCNWFFYFYEMK